MEQEFYKTNESITASAESLKEFAGERYRDMFLSAYRMFPEFQVLERTRFQFPQSSEIHSDALEEAAYPTVHLGLISQLTPPARDKLIKRLDLPSHASKPEYDQLMHSFVFAHELGHVMQADKNFEFVFGNIDLPNSNTIENLQQFETSDRELNADYIMAVVVGNSFLGRQLDIQVPKHKPSEWRQWAMEHS